MAVSTGSPEPQETYEALDAAALIKVGEILWGSYWKRQVAAALDVTEFTINRWSVRGHPIPLQKWRALLKIASRRQQQIGEMVAQLIEAIPAVDPGRK